jgi:hypothetical protein
MALATSTAAWYTRKSPPWPPLAGKNVSFGWSAHAACG